MLRAVPAHHQTTELSPASDTGERTRCSPQESVETKPEIGSGVQIRNRLFGWPEIQLHINDNVTPFPCPHVQGVWQQIVCLVFEVRVSAVVSLVYIVLLLTLLTGLITCLHINKQSFFHFRNIGIRMCHGGHSIIQYFHNMVSATSISGFRWDSIKPLVAGSLPVAFSQASDWPV